MSSEKQKIRDAKKEYELKIKQPGFICRHRNDLVFGGLYVRRGRDRSDYWLCIPAYKSKPGSFDDIIILKKRLVLISNGDQKTPTQVCKAKKMNMVNNSGLELVEIKTLR